MNQLNLILNIEKLVASIIMKWVILFFKMILFIAWDSRYNGGVGAGIFYYHHATGYGNYSFRIILTP